MGDVDLRGDFPVGLSGGEQFAEHVGAKRGLVVGEDPLLMAITLENGLDDQVTGLRAIERSRLRSARAMTTSTS